jgi:hypothetical protein
MPKFENRSGHTALDNVRGASNTRRPYITTFFDQAGMQRLRVIRALLTWSAEAAESTWVSGSGAFWHEDAAAKRAVYNFPPQGGARLAEEPDMDAGVFKQKILRRLHYSSSTFMPAQKALHLDLLLRMRRSNNLS